MITYIFIVSGESILTRDIIPSQRQGKRRTISLLATKRDRKHANSNMKTKNKNKVTFSTNDTPENPIYFKTFFHTENLGTKCTNVSYNTNSEKTLTLPRNKETTNLVKNVHPTKRKLTNEQIISEAKKLPKITISEAKENIDNKIMVTKFMFDRINKYDSIVESKIGKKHKKNYSNLSKFGKPHKDLNFVVEKAFDHVLCPLFKSGFLDFESVKNLCSVHVLYQHYYVAMYRSLQIDFSPLWEPNPNWNDQLEIPFKKRMQLLSCAYYVDFNIPFMLRYLGGQYTGDDRNVTKILNNINGKVPENLYIDIKRILTVGAPTYLSGEMSRENFLSYWRYGNHRNMEDDPQKLKKVLNKEDKHKYMFSLPIWSTRFIPNLHLSPQGIIQKKGKEDRLVNDASHLRNYDSTCLNMLTHPEKEPTLEYGSAFTDYLTHIYDLRITHPTEDLLLYSDDVSGAFRWPRLNPYIASSMAYILLDSVNIPAGQVFGSNASAQNFEQIAKARKKLAQLLFTDKTLIKKYDEILKNVKFCEKPTKNTTFVQAKPCKLRKGVKNEQGQLRNPPLFMFVDDSLMCEIHSRILHLLAASIESLFQIMGEDIPELRRSNLSMEKYYKIICSYIQVQLGVVVNTRTMTVSMTNEKTKNLINELEAWHSARKSFVIREAGTLLGQLNNAAEVSYWARFLFSNIRNSIIVSLRKNRTAVHNNKRFSEYIKDSQNSDQDDVCILRKKFALSKIAKEIWNSKIRCFISKSLRQELQLLAYILKNKDFKWETPIAHLIPRTPDFSAWGDSSLDAAGGFSVDLQFFWHLSWPEEIRSKTLKYFSIRSKEKEKLISINLLEYVVVIVNYAIATEIIRQKNYCKIFKYQTLLNWSDNKTAISWTRKAAISTESGKALSRIFCTLCINNDINCISEYINTKDNEIADKISRSDLSFSSNVTKLQKEFKELGNCRRYRLNPEFVSCLIRALLTGQSPPVGRLPKTGYWCHVNDIM